jgi:hypothetical protein
MMQKGVSSLPEAMQLLEKWGEEGRTVSLAFLTVAGGEIALFSVEGKIVEIEGPSVRVFSQTGRATISLAGATINPPHKFVRPQNARAALEEVEALVPYDSTGVIEFLLPSGNFGMIWDVPA